ncbi:MAG TPA: type II secretion system F family protein [Candidatus Saccharimonadales bacterium]|nr:type II secretion system F family protein [Candidatus Saccharimonadales bacterium]
MKFNYIATTKDGKTQQGIIEAPTHDEAIAMLGRQQLKPVVVKSSGGKNVLNLSFGNKVKSRDLVIFTRQLSTMISAGVPLARALSTLQAQSDSKYFRSVIESITKDVEGGRPLADAFARYPNVFSEVYVNMIRAGEAAGILDKILKRLAAQEEKQASIHKKIVSAMTYPSVIMAIMVVAFFFIMIFLMPKIGKIIQNLTPGAQLPIQTRIMLGLSHIMQHYAPILIPLIVIGTFLFLRYIKTPKGKYQWHVFLLRVPVLSVVIRKIAIARFARTFASLMSAGVSVLESLDVTGGAIGNKVIEKELKAAAIEVKNGKQLSETLAKSKNFPPIISQMLAVGEETGQIDTILEKVADFYDEEVDATIEGLSSIIEPILIVVLGSVVGLIAASVMGPIASLNKNIGN